MRMFLNKTDSQNREIEQQETNAKATNNKIERKTNQQNNQQYSH